MTVIPYLKQKIIEPTNSSIFFPQSTWVGRESPRQYPCSAQPLFCVLCKHLTSKFHFFTNKIYLIIHCLLGIVRDCFFFFFFFFCGTHRICCSVAQFCLTLCDPMVPLSKGFPRQEYWSGLPFCSPGDLPSPGMEPTSALAGRFFTTEPRGKPIYRRGIE